MTQKMTENMMCEHCFGNPYFTQLPQTIHFFYSTQEDQYKDQYVVSYNLENKTVSLYYKQQPLLKNYPSLMPHPHYLAEDIMRLVKISKLKAFL